MTAFDKAWAVAKNERFGEKFNEKLRRMKEGARPVPEKFSDLRSTTPERDNFDVMAEILETDSDGVVGEYERLKDMFDNEPPTHSAPNALGSKGLIDRARKAGKGPVKKSEDAFDMFIMDSGHNAMTMEDAVEAVRMFVEADNEVMPSVQLVANRLGIEGKELMRAYVEAYK